METALSYLLCIFIPGISLLGLPMAAFITRNKTLLIVVHALWWLWALGYAFLCRAELNEIGADFYVQVMFFFMTAPFIVLIFIGAIMTIIMIFLKKIPDYLVLKVSAFLLIAFMILLGAFQYLYFFQPQILSNIFFS